MLQMLLEASASGLLRTLQTDPFEPRDVLHLKHVLQRLRSERYLRYSSRELMTALVRQICMAIGKRDRYPAAYEDVVNLLTYLREIDLPGHRDKVATKSEYEQLIDLWTRTFGDPDEMERRQARRNAVMGVGESEEARQARQQQKYIQTRFLR